MVYSRLRSFPSGDGVPSAVSRLWLGPGLGSRQVETSGNPPGVGDDTVYAAAGVVYFLSLLPSLKLVWDSICACMLSILV